MQNNFFGSKLNSVLLLVLIILLGFVLRFMYQDKAKYLPFMEGEKEEVENKDNLNEVKSEIKKEQSKETNTYTKHGFSIELPRGFIPVEQKRKGDTTTNISMPEGNLSYVIDVASWEKLELPEGSKNCLKSNELIGKTTFTVYNCGNNENEYWFKKGAVGYDFRGNKEILKTFKFVGWAKETKCESEFCVDGLAPDNIIYTKTTTYESIGISKIELEKLVIKNFGDCSLPETCSRKSMELSLADMKINGVLYQGIPIVTVIQTLADDSVGTEKYIVKLYKDASGDDVWRFSKPYTTWACVPGRGHQSFNQELCI